MITKDDFTKLIAGYNGNIELNTTTKAKMNKGGRGGVEPNPFYDRDVRRVKTSTYEVGANYLEKINEALIAEGKKPVTQEEFSNKLPWGEYEIKDKVIAHNGARYLRCYPVKDADTFEEITVDGAPATKEDLDVIMPYTSEKKGSKKQEEAGISEEHRVQPLLFSFDSIICATINGTVYELEH